MVSTHLCSIKAEGVRFSCLPTQEPAIIPA